MDNKYEYNGINIQIEEGVNTEFLEDDKLILSKNSHHITKILNISLDVIDKTPNSNKNRITEIKSIKYINSNKITFLIEVDIFTASNGEFVFEHTAFIDVLMFREHQSIRSIYVEKLI